MSRRTSAALLSLALLSPAGPALAQTAAPPPAKIEAAPPPDAGRIARTKPGTPADVLRYRVRQEASPNAREFRGGQEVVVVSAGTVALVLAIVLLVVLL